MKGGKRDERFRDGKVIVQKPRTMHGKKGKTGERSPGCGKKGGKWFGAEGGENDAVLP